MAPQIGDHERADGDDLEPPPAGVGERCLDERRAEAATLQLRVDLRVQERDCAVAALGIGELAGLGAVDVEPVAAVLRLAGDGRASAHAPTVYPLPQAPRHGRRRPSGPRPGARPLDMARESGRRPSLRCTWAVFGFRRPSRTAMSRGLPGTWPKGPSCAA